MHQGNLILAGLIFAIGSFGFLWKRDAIGMFMCIELMLNAANLAFVSFAQAAGRAEGTAAFVFILTVAAAEAGVGLALFIKVFNEKESIRAEDMTMLRDWNPLRDGEPEPGEAAAAKKQPAGEAAA